MGGKKLNNLSYYIKMSKLLKMVTGSVASSKTFPSASGQPSLLKPLQNCCQIHTGSHRRKLFEPDYLDEAGLTPPKYEALNIQIKGHNHEVLENHQGYIHRLAENLGIEVSESWATACESFSASVYAPQSTKVNSTFNLNVFERNVQVVDVLSTELPVLLDVLRKTLPEGVSLSVHKHSNEHYEARYIPDPLIQGVTQELEEIEAARAEAIAIKRAERDAKRA